MSSGPLNCLGVRFLQTLNNISMILSGDLTVGGNTTLGDAAGDSVTVNGATVDYAAASTRIKGDFSNGTFASRAAFMDRTTNNGTIVGALPNGTSNNSGFTAYSSSTPDNSHYLTVSVGTTYAQIDSGKLGSGTQRSLDLAINGTTYAKLATDGSFQSVSGTKLVKLDAVNSVALVTDTGGVDSSSMTPARVAQGTVSTYAGFTGGYIFIKDGISAPTADVNHAAIYIDIADGDLKIKFADGTVKTIVVDT